MKIQVPADLSRDCTVTWIEPRLHRSFLWERTIEVKSSLTVKMREDRLLLVFYDGKAKQRYGVSYQNVVGFAVATAEELFERGDKKLPKEPPKYRSSFVIYAQLQRSENGNNMLMLTETCAAKADVMRLHGVLTEIFVVQRPLLMKTVTARAEQQAAAEVIAIERAESLRPPRLHRGRYFVEPQISPMDEPRLHGAKPYQPGTGIFRSQMHVLSGSILIGFADVVRRPDGQLHGLLRTAKVSYDDGHATDLFTMCLYAPSWQVTGTRLRQDLVSCAAHEGGELEVPTEYLPFPDAARDGTRVLCAEFNDGALLPLLFAVHEHKIDMEALAQTIVAAAHASGLHEAPSAIAF